MSEPTFGEWLRKQRKRAGMTQMALSVKCGVSQAHISLMEIGSQPRIEGQIAEICRALDLDEHEAYHRAGRLPPWLVEKLMAGGPALWEEMHKEFFGRGEHEEKS